MSTGGILICRPLLDFPKTRLLATCHDHHIPYVSDPTNFDPTLTPRNAIRSLISSDKLPRALHSRSILSLIHSSQSLLEHSSAISNQLLGTCTALDTNLPAGTIAIRFPSAPQTAAATHPLPQHRVQQIQTLTLRRITDLLSPFPENHFPLRSFDPFTHLVFPTDPTPPIPRHAFTLGGVLFQPLHWPQSSAGGGSSSPADTAASAPHNSTTWLLSRQPYMRNRLPILQRELPLSWGRNSSAFQEPEYTPWTLWDDRYWFRFAVTAPNAETWGEAATTAPVPVSVAIRPFQPADLQAVRRVVRENQLREGGASKKKDPALTAFLDRLARVAPGRVRFTLPLLELVETDGSGIERRVPLALPTLRMWLPGMHAGRHGAAQWTVEWEWMYKMVDREALQLMGSVGN